MTGKTYRIGEAALMLNLKTYVLRFWETEFPELRPLRTEKGQRLYTEQHVELLKRIRHLLHERGMTIEGAKRRLAEPDTAGSAEPSQGASVGFDTSISPDLLATVQAELLDIRRMLQPDGDDS
jgi:DNA-binding transcriptional MerR regulator